jgi:F420-0:gamma-glutamyl ligase
MLVFMDREGVVQLAEGGLVVVAALAHVVAVAAALVDGEALEVVMVVVVGAPETPMLNIHLNPMVRMEDTTMDIAAETCNPVNKSWFATCVYSCSLL